VIPVTEQTEQLGLQMVLSWSHQATSPDSIKYVVPNFTIYRKYKIKMKKKKTLTKAVLSMV
jgi:hypothetical protein